MRATPANLPRITLGLLITQGHWGGAQRYVFDLATSLAPEMRVIVGVGSPNRGTELQARLAAWNATHPATPIEVQQLTHLVREIAPWQDLRALREIRQFVTRNRISILHCNSAKASVIGSLALLGSNVRRVITIHGFTHTEPLSTLRALFYRELERIATRSVDLVICPDVASYTIAHDQFHIPEKNLACIPHTIEEPAFLSRKDARSELSRRCGVPIPPTTHVIGSIANLYHVKNHALLLESFAELAHTDRDALCIIIGEGNERAALERLRASLACAHRIFFLGAIDNAATLLRGFDVFALTSHKEGYPYALLEARAAGIPIVARAVGGCAEILKDIATATCLTTAHAPAIAQALQAALQNTTSPAAHFSRNRMQDATKERYLALITDKLLVKGNE